MADAGRPPDISDLNPNFAPRLAAFRAALAKEGIETSILSGYRTPEYQNQMYQNHLAVQARRPLPYPNVEAPNVVAPGWGSFHNYGLAADLQPSNGNYARMAALAPQFGLTGIGSSDPGHFQLGGGNLGSVLTTNKIAQGWRPTSGTQVASNAPTYAAAPGQPAGNPFFSSLHQIESGGRNIYSTVDKDYPGQPNSRSQGYDQIDVPTWRTFGAKAGIDLNKYPTPMTAADGTPVPQSIQDSVASQIPISRFGSRTQKMLQQQFGQFDTSKTVGELSQQFGGANAQGTTVTSVPTQAGGPGAAPGTAGSTVNPPIPGASGGTAVAATPTTGGMLGAAWGALNQGSGAGGKSPLEKMTDQLGGGGGDQQKPPPPSPITPAPPLQRESPGAAQLAAQTLAAGQKPISWGSAPPGQMFGAGAGDQSAELQSPQAQWQAMMMQREMAGAGGTPGMTLNSTGYV